MSTQSITTPLNGATLLAVPFAYINESHVEVYTRTTLEGASQIVFDGDLLVQEVDYTFLSLGQISLTTPADGATDYLVRRATPRAPLVTQQPGVFSSEKANLSSSQFSYVDEEQDDTLEGGLATMNDLFSRTVRLPQGTVLNELASWPQGTFLTRNAAGQVITSTGTGSDPALRSDLAAAGGGALVALSYGSTVQALLAGSTNRTALKALTPANGAKARLTEGLRSGEFVFSTADLSAEVTLDTAEAVFIPPASDATGASGAWVRAGYRLADIHLGWFGAAFDVGTAGSIGAATDDTAAFNAAIAFVDQYMGGGTIRLPAGVSKVTSKISVPIERAIHFVGNGPRKNYPDDDGDGSFEAYTAGTKLSSTVIGVHAGRALFEMVVDANDGEGGASFRDLSLATLQTGSVPDCALGLDTSGGFLYQFTAENVSITGFKNGSNDGTAIEMYNSGGSGGGVGAILIRNCAINFNNRAFYCSDSTFLNEFTFENNKAGKNDTAGVRVEGANVYIANNILESTPDPIHVRGGGYKACVIKNNYFESCSGDACVYVRERIGFDIGPNNYTNNPLVTHLCQIVASGRGLCLDPFWGQGVLKSRTVRLKDAMDNSLSISHFRVDDFHGEGNWAEAPPALSSRDIEATANIVRDLHPGNGMPFPAQQIDTSSALFADWNIGTAVTGAIGNWLMASIVMKRLDDSNLDPLLRISINSSAQTQDTTMSYFAGYFAAGEWAILTAAMKLTQAISTNTIVRLYPYGTGAGTGLVANVGHPYIATVDDINEVRPYASPMLNRAPSSAAPTTGTWVGGDILMNRAMAAASPPGFVCTASGSPGTWKAMAAVAA